MTHNLRTYYDEAITRLLYRPVKPLRITISATEISGKGIFDAGRLFNIPLRADGTLYVKVLDGEISIEVYLSPYAICDLDEGQRILARYVFHTGSYDITNKQWHYTTRQVW